MNVWCSLIIMFVGIARPTTAVKVFEDTNILKVEVEKYCRSPAKYEKSDGREKYGPIEKWNVSAVTNMESLFRGFSSCNPPISKWNVGAVKTFAYMFYGASSFNQDISGWDVSSSNNFNDMFNGATAFDQDLSRWDVSNGIRFNDMFNGATAFDQDLSRWDVSNGIRFYSMFKDSGMNHFIGGWQFWSSKLVGRRDVFFAMLDMSLGAESPYVVIYSYERVEQLLNILTVDIGNGVEKITDDKGMRGEELENFI